MGDMQLPRPVIDRLEDRWANRLQQDAKEHGAATRPDPLSPVMRSSTALALFPLSSSALDVLRTPLSSYRAVRRRNVTQIR